MSSGSPGFEPPSIVLLGHNQGAGLEVEQLKYNPVPILDTGACR